jgi:hypothetical protein
MRPIEISLSFDNLLKLFAMAQSYWLRAASRARYSALIAVPIAGVQALAEGLRWQLIPAYALSGLSVAQWAYRGLALGERAFFAVNPICFVNEKTPFTGTSSA